LSVLNGKTQFAQKCQDINMRTLKKKFEWRNTATSRYLKQNHIYHNYWLRLNSPVLVWH